MLINFCNADLVTKISSSASECEDHSVNNLISKVKSDREKGFMVDYFIKPPITIEIEFRCEIQLSHIILWPRIGGQKTVGVELLTRNRSEHAFNCIVAACMKSEKAGFFFCKHGHTNTKQWENRNFLVQYFKSTRLLRSQSLQIKIFKTLGSSVPALQKVEIWGEISKGCPRKVVDEVLTAWKNLNDMRKLVFNEICVSDKSELKEKKVSEHCADIGSSQINIPDEFVDPISCEIMTVPMILPCGKVIDSLTLERFIDEEAKWGRLPSDPFTGKLFTETSRPKMCVDLKLRIDKFLLDNCNELYCKTLPRTVGGYGHSNAPKISSLVLNNSGVKINESHGCTSLHKVSVPSSCLPSLDTLNDRKRKFVCITDNFLNIRDDKESDTSPKKQLGISEKPSTLTSVINIQKYDEMKERSLEFSLKATLSNLQTKNTAKNDKVICFKCNAMNVLYQLPCEHYFCRVCISTLLETNCSKCMKCNVVFKTSDPKRIHSIKW